MDARDRAAFGSEIHLQCRVAISSWKLVHDATHASIDTGINLDEETGRIIVGLQSFLVAAGILSDIFFPDKKKGDQLRGSALRAEYGVAVDSPFTRLNVRNGFVHIDERMDAFLRAHPDRSVPLGPFSVGRVDVPPGAIGETQFLRILDSTNWRVLVNDKSLELRPVFEEISRIFPVAERYKVEMKRRPGSDATRVSP